MNNELTTISVCNAGLVIVQSFVEILFDRLGLVNEGKFISEGEQDKAIHALQFLVTGLDKNSEEPYLLLNKILCGKPLESPIESQYEINETDKELMDSLIKAAINHWPSNGSSSNTGFRGNWLIRDGVLIEKTDHWELIIEKRTYDILLQRSPLSFSTIKFKWMIKPLFVTWNY